MTDFDDDRRVRRIEKRERHRHANAPDFSGWTALQTVVTRNATASPRPLHWLHERPRPGSLPFDEFHWIIPQEAPRFDNVSFASDVH